jgi:uncharacterized protein YbjT (DUF2867 family)
MFVVAGASGNTGKIVAETLLGQGKKVRVLVRGAKADPWKARGVDVAQVELDDVDALTGALRGADGAYLLVPPMYRDSNVRQKNARRSEGMARAIDASGVRHVVFLSSIGAQHGTGTGPILSLHDAEVTLGRARADVTSLRAAYFMENWASSLYALGQGLLPTFLVSDKRMPMVATHDIGLAAAKLLVEGGAGKRVVEIGGPREYSPKDAAEALSRILGRSITVQQGPEDAMPAALTGAGFSAEVAGLFQEMVHGINTDHVAWEAGHSRVAGSTELEAVLSKLVAAR